MPISSLWKLRYPAPTDPADVPTDLGNLTSDLDARLGTGYGTLAARPAASATWPGYTYYATDTTLLYRSDGVSTWTAITAAASPGVTVLDRYRTPTVTVTNTTSLSTIYTYTVVGGTLSTNKRLRLILMADILMGAAATLTFYVKLGISSNILYQGTSGTL